MTTSRLSVVIICGERSRSFDPDNVATCICDWLEPATKGSARSAKMEDGERRGHNGKPRGWGVGLVENDNQIVAYGIHCAELGIHQTHTTILIAPWTKIAVAAKSYVDAHEVLASTYVQPLDQVGNL